MVSLTDTHCHLNAPVFADRIGDVVARACAAGVGRIIVPGWDEASSRRAVALAHAYPVVRAAVGLHPWFVRGGDDLGWLAPLLGDPAVVGVGEIGYDVAEGFDPAAQEMALRAQLALAAERDVPVLLHCRRGWDHLLSALRRTPVRGIVHAFSGSLETMRLCLDLGLCLGVGPLVTRPNARRAREAVRHAPLDRLVLETDAPNMAFARRPASEAEPAHLPEVLACVAELRGAAPAAVAEASTRTVATLGM